MEVVIGTARTAISSFTGWKSLPTTYGRKKPAHFDVATGDIPVDEIRFLLPAEGTLLVDDLLLYEPGE